MKSYDDNVAVLTVNGVDRPFPQGLPASVADLLNQLGMDAAAVVAEIDGRIVERKDFASQGLRPGQTIELVRFVGGG
jgi:sulfur carrier protein